MESHLLLQAGQVGESLLPDCLSYCWSQLVVDLLLTSAFWRKFSRLFQSWMLEPQVAIRWLSAAATSQLA